MAKKQKFPRYLRKEEVVKLLEKVYDTESGVRDRLFLRMLLGTGLRRAEAVNITPGDIRLREGVLQVREGKGCKDRVIPIQTALAQELLDYAEYKRKNTDEPIFRFSLTWVNHLVTKYGQRAGIGSIHPHTLRHTFAVQSILAGRDLATVQHDLGHSNIQTTSIYLQMTAEDRKRVHAANPLPWEIEGGA